MHFRNQDQLFTLFPRFSREISQKNREYWEAILCGKRCTLSVQRGTKSRNRTDSSTGINNQKEADRLVKNKIQRVHPSGYGRVWERDPEYQGSQKRTRYPNTRYLSQPITNSILRL